MATKETEAILAWEVQNAVLILIVLDSLSYNTASGSKNYLRTSFLCDMDHTQFVPSYKSSFSYIPYLPVHADKC